MVNCKTCLYFKPTREGFGTCTNRDAITYQLAVFENSVCGFWRNKKATNERDVVDYLSNVFGFKENG